MISYQTYIDNRWKTTSARLQGQFWRQLFYIRPSSVIQFVFSLLSRKLFFNSRIMVHLDCRLLFTDDRLFIPLLFIHNCFHNCLLKNLRLPFKIQTVVLSLKNEKRSRNNYYKLFGNRGKTCPGGHRCPRSANRK